MRVGLFTDTYFPQVSGVATSIRTLKEELEKLGHEVYIFTTTDKDVKRFEDPTIIRLPSVPFFAFKDRRVAYRGLSEAYKIAKDYDLDIIHTQTEFSLGMMGKQIAKELHLPLVHTYHTQYEDYVHYIAKGHLVTPGMVKFLVREFMWDLDGVICPSRIVQNVLDTYEVKTPKRIIPTGIVLDQYVGDNITNAEIQALREQLGITSDETMLLSLSRISYEKNIQAVLKRLPDVLRENDKVKLVVVGDGPYLDTLKELARQLGIEKHVIFTGMVPHGQTVLYYKACDFFISASTSETQGLTYIESLAAGRPIIAHGNAYLDDVITDKMFGTLYYKESELDDAILDAIACTPEPDAKRWQTKCQEISSETFGKHVAQFYLDTIIKKETEEAQETGVLYSFRTDARNVTVRLARTSLSLPVRFAETTVKTSAKVLKVPVKLVGTIRDLLD
ncbi:glycosyltransferase family 4 protein [Streptococcus caprae]|uniref:Glycosyltransferase family 4 protein n=1 Tax=Streptococcus caprae TaxID=1640501 RepID=A0ABV8CUF3_9STRE